MVRSVPILIALIALLLVAAPGRAQVVTPGPDAATIECQHPPLPPGAPTPLSPATPAEALTDGTPSAQEAPASPAAELALPDPTEGTPADQATIERVLAAELNLFACFNSGNFLGAAALYTPEALLENLGLTNPYDLPALMAGEPPITLLSIENVRVLDDGRIRYQDRYQVGDMIYTDINDLVERDGFLLLAKTYGVSTEVAPGVASPTP